MASITGIELGPDSCLLAGVRPYRSGGAEVFALHRIDAGDWPSHDEAMSAALRAARMAKGLPRRASVVAWGLPDGAVDDVVARSALRPVAAAGFRIESILTPPQALARLAAMRPRNSPSEAVAWLAINMQGAAIAIVGGSELLFSRTFQWKYNPNPESGRAHLLQRYSLVAHLAPELRRGMDVVRQSHGLAVEAVVTCGDLPELRSLTMPLIEELDLDVETLDSTDGLHTAPRAAIDRFAESAPSLRLACAAALAPATQSSRAGSLPAVARIAAGVALIAALGWGAYALWNLVPASTAKPVPVPQRAATTRPPAAKPVPAEPVRPMPSGVATADPKASPSTVGSQAKPMPAKPAPSLATAASTQPVARTEARPSRPVTRPEPGPAPAVPSTKTANTAPAEILTGTAQRPLAQPLAERKPPNPVPSSTVSLSSEEQTPGSFETRSRVSPSPAELRPRDRQAAMAEPLPTVDSILIDQGRRLALIDGAIVGVGEAVGPRVVVQIDRNAVVLREPSGRIVRVRLRAPTGG